MQFKLDHENKRRKPGRAFVREQSLLDMIVKWTFLLGPYIRVNSSLFSVKGNEMAVVKQSLLYPIRRKSSVHTGVRT